MKALAPAVPPVLILGTQMVSSVFGPTGVSTGSVLSSANTFFQSNSTHFCVWSQTDTATASKRCTMPYYDLTRQIHTSMSRWAGAAAARSSLANIPFQRKSSHFLQLTDENDVFVCHWRLANLDSWPHLRHGCALVHHSFSEWQYLARVCFPSPKTHAQTQLSRRFPLEIL